MMEWTLRNTTGTKCILLKGKAVSFSGQSCIDLDTQFSWSLDDSNMIP